MARIRYQDPQQKIWGVGELDRLERVKTCGAIVCVAAAFGLVIATFSDGVQRAVDTAKFPHITETADKSPAPRMR